VAERTKDEQRVIIEMHIELCAAVTTAIEEAGQKIGFGMAMPGATASLTHLISRLACGDNQQMKEDMVGEVQALASNYMKRVKDEQEARRRREAAEDEAAGGADSSGD